MHVTLVNEYPVCMLNSVAQLSSEGILGDSLSPKIGGRNNEV